MGVRPPLTFAFVRGVSTFEHFRSVNSLDVDGNKQRLSEDCCLSRQDTIPVSIDNPRASLKWMLCPAWLLSFTTILWLVREQHFLLQSAFPEDRCAAPWPTLGETVNASQICITTLSDAKYRSTYTEASIRDFSDVLEVTWDNKMQYAAKHDYKLFNASNLVDLRRPAAWSKILAVQNALKGGCDWVFWMDADSLIMNSQTRIEDILPSRKQIDLVIAMDADAYNSGMWMVRNSDWTMQFLKDWWSMTDFIRPPGDRRSGDNYALDALLKGMDDRKEHVYIAPRCSFNSFSWSTGIQHWRKYLQNKHAFFNSVYRNGDFIIHFAGMDDKMACIKKFKQQVM